jgi:hypothetical protein
MLHTMFRGLPLSWHTKLSLTERSYVCVNSGMCIYMCMCVCVWVNRGFWVSCTHTHTYIYIYTYTHIHTYAYIHTYIHTYTHTYIHTHTHTHTHTHLPHELVQFHQFRSRGAFVLYVCIEYIGVVSVYIQYNCVYYWDTLYLTQLSQLLLQRLHSALVPLYICMCVICASLV